MPSHVHVVAVPSTEQSLRLAIQDGSPAVYEESQLPERLDGLFVARKIFPVADGRAALVGGGPLCGTQPSQGTIGRDATRLPLEQLPRPSDRT